jgi:hypothetical protein
MPIFSHQSDGQHAPPVVTMVAAGEVEARKKTGRRLLSSRRSRLPFAQGYEDCRHSCCAVCKKNAAYPKRPAARRTSPRHATEENAPPAGVDDDGRRGRRQDKKPTNGRHIGQGESEMGPSGRMCHLSSLKSRRLLSASTLATPHERFWTRPGHRGETPAACVASSQQVCDS